VRRWLLLAALGFLALGPVLAVAQGNQTAAVDGGSTLNVSRILLTLALIIGLGFAGFLVFDRFRIADVIFLIGFGILLGYVGFLDVELFRAFQPLVAIFAVLIIMFDAGLGLRFGDLAIPKMGWALVLTTIGFALTLALVGAVGHFFLGLPWVLALILAAAVTDTTGLVILPIIAQLGIPSKVKTALLVETSVPDVYAITLVILLMNVADPASAAELGPSSGNLIGGFTSTLVIGFLVGFVWIHALGWLATRRYAYMTTLAVVLGLNWVVDAVGGSGPVAVLLFGLVIGNRVLFGKWADTGKQKVFRDMLQFNGEVAFLVRSFFFVYLGVILDVRSLTTSFVVAALLIVAAILVARTVAVYVMTPTSSGLRSYRGLLIATIPRGTTAAVLGTLPAARGLSGTEAFASYAVAVILLTNLLFTVGLFVFFQRGWRFGSAAEAA
jgi:potassium/hydrogen antiporter